MLFQNDSTIGQRKRKGNMNDKNDKNDNVKCKY